ncbi:hypothetical protein Tther_01945 [Tepidimonas thermarum]|uniref:Uncharacterized protein n=1 Tax=Tepidimonas thermarum TaxID=335431 RepID=A0A554WYI4_9BURK|nr:hypothetical protein Tther_01945 [Tepidimonas thermarum]
MHDLEVAGPADDDVTALVVLATVDQLREHAAGHRHRQARQPRVDVGRGDAVGIRRPDDQAARALRQRVGGQPLHRGRRGVGGEGDKGFGQHGTTGRWAESF